MALFVFFLIILFPLLNLMGIGLSAGMLCMLTHQIATRAAEQLTYAEALSVMKSECTRLMGTGWAHFLNPQPRAGYQTCGSDLYIESSQINGGSQIQQHGPNKPLTGPPSPNNVYEYVASTSFAVKPLIPMSGVPLVSQIPGLGQPVEITWSAARAVEHVAGLASNGVGVQAVNINFPNLALLTGPDPPATMLNTSGVIPKGWRNPGVYAAINKQIIAEDILVVPANSLTWVPTILNVDKSKNQSIWIDTHADGLWNGSPKSSIYDAGGINPPVIYTDANSDGRAFGVNLNPNPVWIELIGFVGPNPPNVTSVAGGPFPPLPYPINIPGLFFLSVNSLNPAPASGKIQLLCNDHQRDDNKGVQAVRIFILQ
jgi:hypothetical protein